MHVLITGGAGFIGSHLAERLVSLGHRVTCIDDLSTGRVEHLQSVQGHTAFTFCCDTIFHREKMRELVKGCDVIFHLAAAVGVKRIVEFPVQTIQTNVAGTEIVLSVAAEFGRRVVLASTSEVYGKSTKLPFSENDDIVLGSTTNSRWGYACSKAIDEFLALAYFRERKLPVTVVRFFNTVGPRQTGQYGMVVPSFVKQALNGAPITVYGSGDQSRCFGHVLDIVDGLTLILGDPTTSGEIFNLGNTEEISIKQLATRIIAAASSESRIVFVPYSEAYAPGFEDMFRRVPDIRKAKEWFGFVPKRKLDDILADVIEYVRPQLAPAKSDPALARVSR